MVLADRNSENMRNGRRSRGPSPNGHAIGSPASSSDDENCEFLLEKEIRIKHEKKHLLNVS